MGALEPTIFAQLALKYVRMFVLINSHMSMDLGHWGQKVGHLVKYQKCLVGALEATFLAQLA